MNMLGLLLAVAPRLGSGMNEGDRDVRGQGLMGGVMGSLRVIELHLVAFILVFLASGLVPLVDLISPLFVSLYLLALSRWAFPSYRKPGNATEVFRGGRMFQFYIVVGTTVGLFLPLSYILGRFSRGDQEAVRSATPHLFLLSFQILSENIIMGLSIFSPPVWVLVPLLYIVRRVFLLIDWTHTMFVKTKKPENPCFQEKIWIRLGRGLASANLIYFTINLFCFLIPSFLPLDFERYFKERAECNGKVAGIQPHTKENAQKKSK